MNILSLDEWRGVVTLSTMAKPRTIGNMIAPPRFLTFLVALIVAFPLASHGLHRWALGAMASFDLAALLFLISCIPLLGTREARVIREHAVANDANRRILLVITGIVMAVLLTAIAAEAVGHNPQPLTKALIIGTLGLAWLFSNMVYALHYAHLVYTHPDMGCVGLEFPRTSHPVYWDFIYFSFTCGMAFATSDVQITETHMRKTVTIHCLAAFAFNIGVLAFTINVLGSGG
jgi:uncharacterized membrane protein